MNPPSTRNPSTSLAFISLHAVGSCARPQRFGSGISNSSPLMSAPAKPWEVDAWERSWRARNLLIQAALWAPSMVERDIILRGPCRVSRSQRDNARSLAWAGSSRMPAVANAAGRAAPRNGTAAAAVMGIKYNGASASRNNRPSASYQFPATTSLFHITLLTILLLNSSTAHFSQNLPTFFFLSRAAWQHPGGHRTDGWASPLHFHAHAAYRSATRFRAEVQREEEQQWDWVVPKRGEACSMPANLQVQRTSVQFSQGAQCCSKTSPSWLPLPPAPLLSKRKIQHGRDLLVGLADAHGSHFHSHPNDGPSG